MNVPPSVTVPLLLQGAAPATLVRAEAWIEAIRRLGRATEVRALNGEVPGGVAQVVVEEATVMLPLEGVIDLGAERVRLEKARAKAEGEARRSSKNSPTLISWRARRRRWWRRTGSGWRRRGRRWRGWRRRWRGSGVGVSPRTALRPAP